MPWRHIDLSETTHAFNASLGAVPAAYTWEGDGSEHIFYRGVDEHIHELWFKGGWNHVDLTAETDSPSAATWGLAAYAWESDSSEHVFYRGVDEHIHELWFKGGWNHVDLTELANAPLACECSIAAYAWEGDQSQHVFYRGVDEHIREFWFKDGWHLADLTAVAGAPLVDQYGALAAFVWEGDGSQHVCYRGADEHIHELWFKAAWSWNHVDLTQITNAALARRCVPAAHARESDQSEHVFYVGGDEHIHELWYRNGWSYADLTQAAVHRRQHATSPPMCGRMTAPNT